MGVCRAIATLGALIQRGVTGRGMKCSRRCSRTTCLMGQHMLQFAVTGRHPAPMPARQLWAIYDVFTSPTASRSPRGGQRGAMACSATSSDCPT
jgi:crotonobetainyl-CoA:carnitine CoA-transferase CaiB-like acyl-CoA transferase